MFCSCFFSIKYRRFLWLFPSTNSGRELPSISLVCSCWLTCPFLKADPKTIHQLKGSRSPKWYPTIPELQNSSLDHIISYYGATIIPNKAGSRTLDESILSGILWLAVSDTSLGALVSCSEARSAACNCASSSSPPMEWFANFFGGQNAPKGAGWSRISWECHQHSKIRPGAWHVYRWWWFYWTWSSYFFAMCHEE